jgi:Domain of unknown function (DUF4145)
MKKPPCTTPESIRGCAAAFNLRISGLVNPRDTMLNTLLILGNSSRSGSRESVKNVEFRRHCSTLTVMQKQPYTPPKFQEAAFHCPFCGVYARQYWMQTWFSERGFEHVQGLEFAHCECCGKRSFWFNRKMIYPDASGIMPPNPDLLPDIQNDYNEAASIVNRSPRGSAAILRLCVQKLCKQLGEPGKNMNDDIGSLVKKGLNPKIQQALDVVRVVGNNAVHPGELDLKDNKDVAVQLFKLTNLIAEKMITEPKEVDEIYGAVVPATSKEAIKKRDGS